MKKLFLVSSLLVSGFAMGSNCEEKVLSDYINALPDYKFHHLTGEVRTFKKFEKNFNYYGMTIDLGYPMDVEVFIAGSEYDGGYGMDALVVDPETCMTLKLENVYQE